MSDPLSDAAASSNDYAQQQAARTIADEAKEASDVALLQDQINKLAARVTTLESEIAPTTPTPVAKAPLGLTSDMSGWTSMRSAALSMGFKWFREGPTGDVVTWAHSNGAKIIGIYRKTSGTNSLALQCDYVEGWNEWWWDGVDLASWAKQMSADADTAAAAGKPFLLPLLAWSGVASFVGSTKFDNQGNYNGVPAVNTINAAAPELFGKCAGFSIHPYAPGTQLTNATMDKVRAQLEAIPSAAGKKFYVTEYGVSSGPSTDAWSAGSETNQANYLAAGIDLLRARTDVALICLYRYNDLNYTNSEGFYGWVRTSGVQKPSYTVVKSRI